MFIKEGQVLVEYKGETGKARKRRLEEGWFEKYAPESQIGLDIGAGDDPLNQTFRRWDQKHGDGDGAVLEGIEPNTFQTVYASHVLEHIPAPRPAIRRWLEVVKPGGHLIILVPHRDLYEKKKELPSCWNHDHKYLWLPDEEEFPYTKSLKKEVTESISDEVAVIESLRVLDQGYNGRGPDDHPWGEYSIEIIVRKQDLIEEGAKRDFGPETCNRYDFEV